MSRPDDLKRALDRWQRRRRPVGFTLAVFRKYSDDNGSFLAATIAYYAFFSIFPLLLVLTTVLGFVLDSNGSVYRSLVDSALGQLPVIGRQLQDAFAVGERHRDRRRDLPRGSGRERACSWPPRTP